VPSTSERANAEQGADDAALLAAIAKGDEAAFASLVARYYDAVYRAVWRLTGGFGDSEDVVQEAFLKLWSNPGQLREARALKSWLMRVASNGALDRLRRPAATALDDAPEPADPGAGPAIDALRGNVSQQIDQAIRALPERQRQALVMVHFEGLSNIDAAAAMEISVEAVESLLARARRGLKAALVDRWQDLLADIGEADV
jgi:RNA polymerase sigma-70 factor (ECF subfamily)